MATRAQLSAVLLPDATPVASRLDLGLVAEDVAASAPVTIPTGKQYLIYDAFDVGQGLVLEGALVVL